MVKLDLYRCVTGEEIASTCYPIDSNACLLRLKLSELRMNACELETLWGLRRLMSYKDLWSRGLDLNQHPLGYHERK